MDGRSPETGREVPRLEVPEDVAILYSWAHLQGGRYRDFSASRRELRAQLRQEVAKARRETEMLAKAEAEMSAAAAERGAQEFAEAARVHELQARRAAGARNDAEEEQERVASQRALQHAGELSRRAARERMEAARRAEAVRSAEESVRRESLVVAEAHAAAQRQAGNYTRMSTAADEVTSEAHPERAQRVAAQDTAAPKQTDEDMRPERFPQRRAPGAMALLPETRTLQNRGEKTSLARSDQRAAPLEEETGIPMQFASAPGREERPGATGEPSSAAEQAPASAMERTRPAAQGEPARVRLPEIASTLLQEPVREASAAGPSRTEPQPAAREPFVERRSEPRPRLPAAPDEKLDIAVPAWIHGQTVAPVSQTGTPSGSSGLAAGETLPNSRERVASRWYALRGVFDPATPAMEPTQARTRHVGSPLLAVFSLAGGVGKTSLTASLGRSLSALGERVLLADLTPQGILPFYFGATELRPGVMRTFSPPPGSADAPVSMVSHDLLSRAEADRGSVESLIQDLGQRKEGFEHVLLDLSRAAEPVLKGLAALDALVLVPVAPDMNTVIGLGAMERFFAGMTDSAGRPLQPRYLLTQFEASMPLHVEVREGLRQKLGQRLLPLTVRRSAEVSEALAEGMTVIDYAPESGVAADYRNLAMWVRSLAVPVAPTEARTARWSER